ncbi:hypothetical protein ACIBEJ_33800 [Nonomuraea sp. NPDC050790]|uniref:hypothetical protein n=1 Tax=Nonomuraea sp. NPDC050790 TaxID=3364371 RepID=UPI0037AC5638
MAAADVEPGGDALSRDRWERDDADLAALAVQTDHAGAGGDRDVIDLQPGAFRFTGPGISRIAMIAA